MAQLEDSHIGRLLAITVPDSLIEKLAVAYGVVERERKIDIVLLVWTLILGFPKGTRRTLASLRRQLVQVSGSSIAHSSFYDRLSPALADLMEQLVGWLLDFRTENTAGDISEKFEGFQELLAVDSTVFQLHEMLVDNFESTNPGEAAGKLHVVANVIDGKTNSVQLTGQTTPDNRPWKTIGSWVENSLLRLDLGYYDFHLFHRIDQQDGFFISRVKTNANPRIVRSNMTCRGNSIDLAGKNLQEVVDRLQRQVIDVTVEVDVELRKYRGSCNTIQKQFRMVGVKNEETGKYHLYFTNVGTHVLDPSDISATYRLRWQVELLFARLKTNFRLHQLPTSKHHVVKILIYASILALLVSNELLRSMRNARPGRVFPARRMDAVFRDFAHLILLTIAARRRDTQLDLFELMTNAAADPNRDRDRSHDILDRIPLSRPDDSRVFAEVSG